MTKTMGTLIAELRKENGMTQAELAEKMNVTDKAVSKWERDLSCPDINSVPKLAENLHITVDELLQAKGREAPEKKESLEKIMGLVWKALALAMGVAILVFAILGLYDNPEGMKTGFTMVGIGLVCTGISLISSQKE